MPETEEAVTPSLKSSLELASSLIKKLGNTFTELEAHEDTYTDKVQRSDVEGHFRHLESVVKKKLEVLEAKEKKYMQKKSMLDEREAEVTAKEQELLDRVQELKDAALAAIIEAKPTTNEVSCSVDDETSQRAEEVAAELTHFCEHMDSKGLLNYVTENLNGLSAVCRQQLSVVLGSATEPARLVLDALEGFFPPNEGPPHEDDKALRITRQSCLILMEALSAFLAKAESSATDNLLNPETKQHAKAIADEWKPKLALESSEGINGKSLEARGFLRLLVTFRIGSEFDEDELCKFVLATAHQRQATELCRALELTPKIPGLVETLISKGRQVEAVKFIHSFELSEAFPPVPLLKAYLKEVRRNLQGNGDEETQNEFNARELEAIRSVIRCVKEFNLEPEYPLDQLQKRCIQLQKSVWDRRRKRDKSKYRKSRELQVTKGGRGGSNHGPKARVSGINNEGVVFSDRSAYIAATERYSPTAPIALSYPVASQSQYTAQVNAQQHAYSYPVSSYAQVGSGSVAYNSAASAGYGDYMQPSQQQPYM